jgi:hypothetical protein
MRARGVILYIAGVVAACVATGVVLTQRQKAQEAERARAFPPQQVVRIPPAGALPPGAMPPGAMPPGAMPPGAMPPGAMPPGAMPPGSSPLLPPSTLPPLLPPIQPGTVSRPPPIPGKIDTTSRPPFGGGVHTQAVIDLNSAPVSALVTLPGITQEYAKLIVAHRPYRDRTDLEKAGLPHDVVEKLGPPAMIRSIETLPPPGKGRSNP